jgi:hypothetical protein
MSIQFIPSRHEQKLARAKACNDLLRFISERGHKFFSDNGAVSFFCMADNGRVWYQDKYRAHPQRSFGNHEWRNFSEGGTLQDFIKRLVHHIRDGRKLPMLTFQYWGYSGSEVAEIQAKMLELGICREVEP